MNREALYFPEVASFQDFVNRVGVRGQQSRPLELCEVTCPEEPDSSAYLLFGYQMPRQLGLFGELLVQSRKVSVSEEGSFFRWKSKQGQENSGSLRQRRSESSLLALLPLLPWEGEPEPLGKVLFWLQDRELMRTIARASLQLSNDRIQYTSLLRNGQETLLLSIESPADYLLQASQEEWSDKVDLYLAVSEELFVEWGYNHPLVDKWRKAEQNGRTWSFLKASGERLRLDSLQWKDIYSATDFKLDFSLEPVAADVAKEATVLTVPLRMDPRTHALRADMWLLQGSAISEFETLLAFAHPDLLHELLISPQTSTTGEPLLFLRERRQGELHRHFAFETTELTLLEDFHNLLLPSNRDLLPQLNRLQYNQIFGLTKGILTVLLEADPEEHNQPYHIVKIQENSFRPLSAWTDYVLLQAKSKIEEKLKQSKFDWKTYESAPSRPELLQKKQQRVQSSARPKAKAGVTTVEPEAEKKKQKKSTKTNKSVVPKRQQKKESVPEDEWLILEREQEHELIKEGPSVERWLALAETKKTLSRERDVLESMTEAIWLVRDEEEDRTIKARWRSQLCEYLGIEGTVSEQLKALRAKARSSNEPAILMAWLLAGEWIPKDQLNDWLSETSRKLRQEEGKLRKKMRWLAWREVLSRNKDVREQARCQELLLKELNEQGVTVNDVPVFLQERLLQSRIELDEDEEADGDLSFAFSMLSELHSEIDGLKSDDIKSVGTAIISRAYAKLGAFSFAEEHQFQWSHKVRELSKTSLAWCTLFFKEAESLRGGAFLKEPWQDLEARKLALKIQDAEQSNTLKMIEKSLVARKQTRSPAELLAKLNEQRLYPATNKNEGEYEKLARLAQRNYRRGQKDALEKKLITAFNNLRSAFSGQGAGLDVIDACKAFDQFLPLLTKLTDLEADSKIATALLGASKAMQKLNLQEALMHGTLESSYLMYLPILEAGIAQGLLILNQELAAMETMRFLVESLSESELSALDFLDMSREVIKAIELMPLSQRFELVSIFGSALRGHLEGVEINFYAMENSYRWLFPLLDQLVECTTSKERWTLEQYKLYTDRDELLIRERILHEDLCDPRPYNQAI